MYTNFFYTYSNLFSGNYYTILKFNKNRNLINFGMSDNSHASCSKEIDEPDEKLDTNKVF